MDELIRYHVRVETGTEPSREMREPRSLHEGDHFNWQGRAYQVVSVKLDPDRPRQAVAIVKRAAVRS